MLDNSLLIEKGLLFLANEFGIQYGKLNWELEYSLMLSFAKEEFKNSKTKDFYSLNTNVEDKSVYEWIGKTGNRQI